VKVLHLAFCVIYLTSSRGELATCQKQDDVKSLIKDLKSNNPKTRASAAEDLGHRGAVRAAEVKEAIPSIVEVLKKDRDANVRKAAATALGQVDPDPSTAVPALTAALRDKAPSVRIAAAGSLGMLGGEAKDAVPALQEAQKDKDRAVSRAASMALRTIRKKN
jgi:HEAT repeat protein